MKKLVSGIIDFRKNVRPSYRDTFARLALGQSPDTLFIACSDSRVAPNVFASTDPGDMFVIRNVGNIIPPCGGADGKSSSDGSAGAAIEFAVANLKVKDVVICGHSDCGAMHALLKGRDQVALPNLKEWLKHGENALKAFRRHESIPSALAPHNRLSQLNVLQQVENLRSYPMVQEKIKAGTLRIHAWWFELGNAAVHCFDSDLGQFVEIDEVRAEKIMDPKGLCCGSVPSHFLDA